MERFDFGTCGFDFDEITTVLWAVRTLSKRFSLRKLDTFVSPHRSEFMTESLERRQL
jgi:hypothetical protein